MDHYCHYISSIDHNNELKSNGSVFFIEHNRETFLLTAAHTLRRYNDFIFPDFSNWHANHITLDDKSIPLYNVKNNQRIPLFVCFDKDDKELLDVVALPFKHVGGPVDHAPKIGEAIKLCGWRRDPNPKKYILDGTIVDINGWDITIELSKYSGMQRGGLSGGGVYTERGFIGVYYADDIGRDTAHAVSIDYILKNMAGPNPV